MKSFSLILLFNVFLGYDIYSQISFEVYDTIDFGEPGNTVYIDDLDNDGFSELIASNSSYGDTAVLWKYWIYIYTQDSNHKLYLKEQIQFSGLPINSMTTCNLDSNELKEIIIAPDYYDSLIILFQTDTLKFERQVVIPNPYGLSCIDCADVNSDGLDDIVSVNAWDGTLGTYYQTEDGNLKDTLQHILTSGKNELLIYDINADGHNDAIITNGTVLTGGTDLFTFGIFLQDTSTHRFKEPIYYDSPTLLWNRTSGIAIGDLNNDNLPDIVTSHFENLKIWFQQEGSDPITWEYKFLPILQNPGPLAIADLNNDGRNEIINFVPGWSCVQVYESDDNFEFSTYKIFDMWYTNWRQKTVAVGDINGDDYKDIVAAHENGRPGINYIINNSYLDPVFITTDISENGLLLYPNPASNFLMFSASDLRDGAPFYYRITDTFGRMVTEQSASYNSSGIDISNLQPGIYLINIQINSKSYISKFIKLGD